MQDLIYKEEVYQIVGAAMEVHTTLGCGFLEPVYQEALEIELSDRKIPFLSQQELPVSFKDRVLQKKYVADLIAYEKIIIELKALETLSSREEAQLINYLKASRYQVGLLINFEAEKLEWKRKVLTSKTSIRVHS